MADQLPTCPACGRNIGLIRTRYKVRANIFRPHYPQPHEYYANRGMGVPPRYCPGTGKHPKGQP